jgi:hypothetical protein
MRAVEWLPDRLEGGVKVGPYSSAAPGRLLRVVPGVGRFLARDGEIVEYCLEEGADHRSAEALIHGGLLGGLIHQRGELPLHASSLAVPGGGRAVALAGHSGAGKSTTSYALTRRGWTLVADDLTRVSFERSGALAWPGRSRLRLLTDACRRFDLDPDRLAPAPNWPGKFEVGLPVHDGPVALRCLVVLDRSDGPLRIDAVTGAAGALLLMEHTYRRHYVDALGCSTSYLRLIAAAVPAMTVLRVRGNAPVAAVADGIAAAAGEIA